MRLMRLEIALPAPSVNQAYRVYSRKDDILFANGTSDTFNRRTMNYNGTDLGSSYGQDSAITTSINDGLLETMHYYKKDFIDSNTAAQFYLEKSEQKYAGTVKTTSYSYTKNVGTRSYPVTTPTTTTASDNLTPDILTEEKQFDDYGNVTQETDPRGIIKIYTYDPVKRLLQTVKVPTDTNANTLTTYSRNAQGDVNQIKVQKENASGEILGQTDYGYDVFGNVTSITQKNGLKNNVTSIDYSSVYQNAFPTQRTTTVTSVDNQPTVITTKAEYYSSTGLVAAWLDGLNNRTSYQYDKLGRVTQVTYPGGKTFLSVYDDIQNTKLVTDEDGVQMKATWNALGWKVEEGVIGPSGYRKKAKHGYDSYGRKVWTDDALGYRTQTQYDNWGRLTKTILPDLTESVTVYNDSLRTVTTTDAEGFSQIETFDKFGRLMRRDEKPTATSSITTTLTNVYHPISGQKIEQTNAKQYKTWYGFNPYTGLMTSVTNHLVR